MAVDPCFLAFLRDVVDIWRPKAAVDGDVVGHMQEQCQALRSSEDSEDNGASPDEVEVV